MKNKTKAYLIIHEESQWIKNRRLFFVCNHAAIHKHAFIGLGLYPRKNALRVLFPYQTHVKTLYTFQIAKRVAIHVIDLIYKMPAA